MLELSDGMILYHGSYCEIQKPDLAKCAPHKDFGQGFYLTSSKKQAENFVGIAMKKAAAQNLINSKQSFGYVSSFVYHASGDIRQYCYPEADADWLHCVVAHRKAGTFPDIIREMNDYDIISGKIADDATNFTITAYITGAYGTVGTKEADNLCIGLLIPERLQNQHCFRTERSLESLEFIGSERV